MAVCPACQHENIPGSDVCESCGTPLTDLDQPKATCPLEDFILEGSLGDMHPKPAIAVPPDTPLEQAVSKLLTTNTGCLLVTKDEKLVGLFSERDLLMRVGLDFERERKSPISEFMTTKLETLSAEDGIVFALNRMVLGDYRHVPITESDKPTGVISVRDVLAHLMAQYPEHPAAQEAGGHS